MNWELFYLVCFVVGFSFTVLSFLGGMGRLHFHHFHFHFHLPKHMHFGGGGHGLSSGLGHGAGIAHGPAHGVGQGHAVRAGRIGQTGHFPFINPMTIAAFLTWFGGTGYLLVRLRHIWILAGLVLSSLVGLAAASVVFVFVAKVLMANDYELDPLDYEMVGVLARVSIPIRVGGTGEVIYVQLGVRKPCAARSEYDEPLAKGEEVVVTRYERGVAYVRRYEELANPVDGSPDTRQRVSN